LNIFFGRTALLYGRVFGGERQTQLNYGGLPFGFELLSDGIMKTSREDETRLAKPLRKLMNELTFGFVLVRFQCSEPWQKFKYWFASVYTQIKSTEKQKVTFQNRLGQKCRTEKVG